MILQHSYTFLVYKYLFEYFFFHSRFLSDTMTSYNHAYITEATMYKRPKQSGPNVVGHWGVVVNVEGHGKYLIHNTPESGTVATPASHMSPQWSSVVSIPVGSKKTIRGCLLASGGAHTNYVSSTLGRYLMGQTCIGTAAAVADY
jgi:hypothetical protein